jgi:hypothetical protein
MLTHADVCWLPEQMNISVTDFCSFLFRWGSCLRTKACRPLESW